MKTRRKQNLKPSTGLKQKQALIYTIVGSLFATLLVGCAVFIYFNLGSNTDSEAASPDYYSVADGEWESGTTWYSGSAPPTNNINADIEIYEYVTRYGDLSYASGAKKTLTVNDTLLIVGDLTMGNKNDVTVNEGGVLIITGNFNADNKIVVGNGGVIAVGGDLNFPSNNQDTYDGSGGGELFVVGEISGNDTATDAQKDASELQSEENGIYTILSENGVTALPITLTYFRAIAEDGRVVLYWQTAQEINNDFFTFERSADGKKFYVIGTMEGAGNSDKALNYQFIDKQPLSGQSFYRLKQTDFDGKFEYFDIITVNSQDSKLTSEQSLEIISVGPNPFNDSFTVAFNLPEYGEVSLQLMNQSGMIVASERIEAYQGRNQYKYQHTDGLKQGIYLMTLTHANYKSKSFKLIKN
ncbi:hypothetical protein OKW21_004533 [Catalinimonas alkaloidigena]|uniref:T9SS type A sorting domain-containing protein n=1 Tax=Catalinimonas alkaloidigena TaxID=1075417 RepID=UPI00240757C9|nr:T9SS type A sorting domain-containing protein [Catalinimonas alkaloidigena]MDF9799270.1 hypothetical protein [Catalinimonas alkaloidigena]